MLKNIAVACNAIVFVLITFFIITKGFPNRGADIAITLLVYVSVITSFVALTGFNPLKKK